MDDGALVGFAGDEGLLPEGFVTVVETQLGLALAGVGAVAGEAVVGENGADVAVELDLRGNGCFGGRKEGGGQPGED